ncbi:MAG: hypothetical protein KKG95_08230 [Candidatus Omnitrophica bacterium]|nr:hypothetical protein [Candidatus Omnitrophota bacterium]
MARYKQLRQHRYEVLKDIGFTATEAATLSESYLKQYRQVYFGDMLQARQELVAEVSALELTKKEKLIELRWQINKQYEINNWQDAYGMMRWFRGIAIAKGDYTPLKRKKYSKEQRDGWSKGDVAKQKLRVKARAERGYIAGTGQFDSEGNIIGGVVFNPATGKYEPKYEVKH